MLAKLPSSLSDLALQRRLSFAVTQLLKGVADWKEETFHQLHNPSDVPCVSSSSDTHQVERCKRLLVHAELNDIEKAMCLATMTYAALFGWYKIQLAIEAEQLLQIDFHRPDEIACLQWAALVIATPIDEWPLEGSNPRIRFLDHVLGQHDRQETGNCSARMYCIYSRTKTQSRSGFCAGRLQCEEESKA